MFQKANSLISLDNLIKLIPATFLYFGYVYLDSYFNYFKINFTSFFGFDEFILIFLPILGILIPFALLLILLWSFIYFYNHKDLLNLRIIDLRFDLNRVHQLTAKSNSKKIKWVALYYLIANMTVLYIVLFLLFNKAAKEQDGYEALVSVLFCSFFLSLIVYDVLKIITKKFPSINFRSIRFLLFYI